MTRGVPFESILLPGAALVEERPTEPVCFHDLGLDQVVNDITAGRAEYDLAPYLYVLLEDLDAIAYRQGVMQEVERAEVTAAVDAFGQAMRTMRQSLAMAKQPLDSRYERERWFLAAVQEYGMAVTRLSTALSALELQSRGLRGLADYVCAYVAGEPFRTLVGEADALVAELAAIRYELLIRDGDITVLPDRGGGDFSAVVEATFARFGQGAVHEYRVRLPDAGRLNHVEAQVLDGVARLHPTAFAALDAFCARHATYMDPRLARFDREGQFCLAYLAYIGRLREAGLDFCYPELSTAPGDLYADAGFDVALASRVVAAHGTLVRNDVVLRGSERILVVTGPNQGGKTTFARTIGQLHYLGSLGCAVPAAAARLLLCDRVFTHFERAEATETMRGKLQDDLVRIHGILEQATARSVVILNEIFASTTLEDAVFLSRKVIAELSRRDVVAVCVTFLDELATFDAKTVSMVGAVDATDPTRRTFRIERRPPDGLAYARAIAEKHRVTARWILVRLPP